MTTRDDAATSKGEVTRVGKRRYTGRHLVMIEPDAVDRAITTLTEKAGVTKMARAFDFGPSGVRADQLGPGEGIVFETLGVAVVPIDPAASQRMAALSGTGHGVQHSEPEQVLYAIETPQPHYLRGYRDAVLDLSARILGDGRGPAAGAAAFERFRDGASTWGLQATQVDQSALSGAGIRVCVLDTGLDLQHPDFANRRIVSQSFSGGASAQDGHGHGTHCIGTACGTNQPPAPPRYGIAWGADIYVGKVLDDQGSGPDGSILAGIDWAIRNRCQVISMSLGSPTDFGERPSPIYERVGRRALRAGSLIVAAAGNESERPGFIAPVGRPANSRSIAAVAALDSALDVAFFSCGGLNPGGGQVDLAAPGVDVFSSWPMPRRTRTISGTSMACPHVAGIAALLAERDPNARGAALWSALVQAARRLNLPATDIGAGLIVAP